MLPSEIGIFDLLPPTAVPHPDLVTAANTGARLKLGQINARLSPISITADGLKELGFEPVATEKNAKLFLESDYPRICEALIQHITQVADFQSA